jgi:hypothetical protein
MERLVDRYLREKALALVPLHPTSMLTRLGNQWKQLFISSLYGLRRRLTSKTALGVFLDIEGALNNTCYDTMCDALVKHGSEYTIVRWIRATLEDHVAVATLNGLSMGLAISRDCLQGGVLSPLL